MENKDEIKKQIKDSTRYRRWCLTNFLIDKYPTKEDWKSALCTCPVKFLVIGYELTKENIKEHYQTYVEFENGRTWSAMHKAFPNIHIEVAKGNCNSNIEYCTKEDKEAIVLGTPNLSESALSKGDIASNIVSYIDSQKGKVNLFEVISLAPEMADYIIKNYRSLTDIRNDIFAYYDNLANERGVEIPAPTDLTF